MPIEIPEGPNSRLLESCQYFSGGVTSHRPPVPFRGTVHYRKPQ
jgi:hypothetical protein